MEIDFNLNDELVAFQDGVLNITNDVSPADISNQELSKILNEMTENLTLSPQAITTTEIFDYAQCLLRDMNSLSPRAMNRVFDIIVSGFKQLVGHLENDIELGNHPYDSYCLPISSYTFLFHLLIHYAEAQRKVEKTQSKKAKGSKNASKNDAPCWDWPGHQARLFEVIYKVLQLPLKRVFSSSQETEVLTGVYVKSMFTILESAENLKVSTIRTKSNHIIAICAKKYGHSFGIQTTVVQNLIYYEHLSEPMAELLFLMSSEYNEPSVVGDVLRKIGESSYSATDKVGPKSNSAFLVRLCELSPQIVNKHMGTLIKQLDSDHYAMRCGMLEILGLLVLDLVSAEPNDTTQTKINRFFDIIEERFKDLNYLVRSRVLQVCGKIAESKAKFPKRRPRLIFLTVGRLEDKSSAVRKNAIKTLTKFLRTHPFLIDGGSLSYELFEKKYNSIVAKLEELQNEQQRNGIKPSSLEKSKKSSKSRTLLQEDEEDQSSDKENTRVSNEVPGSQMDDDTASKFFQYQLNQRYYEDGIFFIEQLKTAIPYLVQLLASTNKSEAVEAMDFFVEAQTYKIKDALLGIKRMIHLVWSKDNAEEGKGFHSHLKDCFYNLYLTAPAAKDHKERINVIAKNLIGLTFDSTLADLTSLEELIRLLTKDRRIHFQVIEKLWGIYGYTKTDTISSHRRGAIMILSMVGKANHELISERLDLMMKIGLGELGQKDLELAKYTCIALQCIGGAFSQKIKGTINISKRLPNTDTLFALLKNLICLPNDDSSWFGMTEQVIQTIYELSQRPDILCQEIIAEKTIQLQNQIKKDAGENDPWILTQLIFIVGHVAVKQIVFLEVVEAEQKQIQSSNKADQSEGDLENVAGSREDAMADMINLIRERELLGHDSLLHKFGSMIYTICSSNSVYNDKTLQIVSTLTLAKLMCVSSSFCDDNLPLLLTILKNSEEPIIRSNIIIALGDVAACFNNLIGENMEYMYDRLKDKDNSVKKNALMVLTHLVLNGMIKVKGQLAEMAKCLVDPDVRISDLAKLFFTELASKDNAIYNNLPDIISHLSLTSKEDNLDKESFRKIMKFLFEFIKDKEKHCENFVDKLCQRFSHLENEQQALDVGYCLSLLPYKSDRTFKKLTDNLKLYQDKLAEPIFFGFMTDIITKVMFGFRFILIMNRLDSKFGNRSELKSLIDDFESSIKKIRAKMDPNAPDEDEPEENGNEENFDDQDETME